MSKREKDFSEQNDQQLEYYTAKQNAGQLPVISEEKKKKATKSSMRNESLRSTSDGYVPNYSHPDKEAKFERYQEITFAQKASDKAKKNPMIPIGMLATVAALTLGLRATTRGDKWQSQMMMRARIGAQGFTIFAVLASIMYAGQSETTRSTAKPTKKTPSTPS